MMASHPRRDQSSFDPDVCLHTTYPGRFIFSGILLCVRGAIAQLVERLHGMQEVSGSIPLSSTITPEAKTKRPKKTPDDYPLGSVSVQKRMFQLDEAFLSDHWSELLFNNVDKIETSERMNLVTMTQAFGCGVL